MTVTKVLQEQAGIQYGGVVDKSEADPRDSMNNVLFTGEFMRGRFDQPMKVYASNIRALLGYDPDNMDYVAIEDALATGAPFVWVQRVTKNVAMVCQKLNDVSPYQKFVIIPDFGGEIEPSQQKVEEALDALVKSGIYTVKGKKFQLSISYYRTDTRVDIVLPEDDWLSSFEEIEFCGSIPFIFEAWSY